MARLRKPPPPDAATTEELLRRVFVLSRKVRLDGASDDEAAELRALVAAAGGWDAVADLAAEVGLSSSRLADPWLPSSRRGIAYLLANTNSI